MNFSGELVKWGRTGMDGYAPERAERRFSGYGSDFGKFESSRRMYGIQNDHSPEL